MGHRRGGAGDIHLGGDDVHECLAGLPGIAQVLLFHLLPQLVQDHGGGLHAAVRQEQSILQLLIEILVDFPIFPGNFVHLFGEVSPGFTQARKQAGK